MTFSRLQLFEFCDQSWLSGELRRQYILCLNALHLVAKPYRVFGKEFVKWASQFPDNKVLDLASGGGGHIEAMLSEESIKKDNFPKVVLSDLNVSKEEYKRLVEKFGEDLISYKEESLDVMDSEALNDFNCISIFTALHHFTPEQVKQIFDNLFIDPKRGLFIAEINSRGFRNIIMSIMAFPLLAIATPLINFSWKTFFFCTLFPIIPFMVAFDGIVSGLRMYNKEEVKKLIPDNYRDQLEIKSGKKFYFGILYASFISITPKVYITSS